MTKVLIDRELLRFLNGEASLDGVWFGERPPWADGPWWWRKHLRAALDAPQPEPVASVDALLLPVQRHLQEALRIPTVPWPDPAAHGQEATGRAVHASFCALRFKVMDALAALTAAWCGITAPPAPAADLSDAYQGAREDLLIWKRRALEAEELNRKFAAEINGPMFMGEPAPAAPSDADLERRTGEPHVDGWPLYSGLPPAALAPIERRLRRMLCLARHGHSAYMDDREASDSSAHPSIDYLRDSLDEIEAKWRQRAALALAAKGE